MTPNPAKIVVYLRTSTKDQRLGIEAQQSTVDRFVAARAWTVVRTFTEHESGGKVERLELDKAIRHARRTGAMLVVAKLDRLARDSQFLKTLVNGDVPIFFCDLPQVDGTATSRFVVGMMAEVAELERGLIRERTKAALAELKKQGKVLGTPANLTPEARLKGSRAGAASRKAKAIADHSDVAAIALKMRTPPLMSSLHQVARHLNEEGYGAPKGGLWTPTQVARVLRRLPK